MRKAQCVQIPAHGRPVLDPAPFLLIVYKNDSPCAEGHRLPCGRWWTQVAEITSKKCEQRISSGELGRWLHR